MKCIKCKKDKLIEEFSKNSSKSSGRNDLCKECHREYRKKYYLDNRIKELTAVKLYQKSHSSDIKAGRTELGKCPECSCIVSLTKKQVSTGYIKYCSKQCRSKAYKYSRYLTGIERRAKKFGKTFDLDTEFIKNLLEEVQYNKCAITKVPIVLKYHKEESTIYDSASLDRIDSSKGYTKDNVQWLVLGINYMKLDYDESEVHTLLKLIQKSGYS